MAAPSAGSAGPVAALMQLWRDSAPERHDERATDFLLAAAAVGGLLRSAGVRQVGCQGEIGVAAAMAAAGYAAVHNASNAQVLHAAERALEPHLGLACDLASGRIEDPCIERGAMAASRAYDAAVAARAHARHRASGSTCSPRSIVESGRAMTEPLQGGVDRRRGGQRGRVLKRAARRYPRGHRVPGVRACCAILGVIPPSRCALAARCRWRLRSPATL